MTIFGRCQNIVRYSVQDSIVLERLQRRVFKLMNKREDESKVIVLVFSLTFEK